MKLFSILVAVAISTNVMAQSKPTFDSTKLSNAVRNSQEQSSQELSKSQARVLQLSQELEQMKGQGAQHWFKRIAQVCGVVVAAGATMVVVGLIKEKRLIGEAEQNGMMQLFGLSFAGAGGACSGVSYLIYELSNGKVEELEKALDIAKEELNKNPEQK